MKKVAVTIFGLIIIGVISIPIIENLSFDSKVFRFKILTNLIQEINSNPSRYKFINTKQISKTLRRPKVIAGGVVGGLLAFNKIGDYIFKKKDEKEHL